MPESKSKQVLSLRLPDATAQQLERLAEVTGRSKSYLALEAIQQFCGTQAWQLEAIAEGIAAAEAGQYVDHETVKARWKAKKNGVKTA